MKTSPTEYQPLTVGTRVGRYEVRRILGIGASGTVYEVQTPKRRFALKLFAPELARRSLRQERFRREFEVLRRMRHPNVVRCFELGWDSERETSFLVMELLEDPTLRHILASPVRRGQVLQVLLQALKGLAHVHEFGLVHRDLKPDNITVGQRTRLIDFGLALPVEFTTEFRSGQGFGTPAYMAPEQANGSVGPAADVWSIGVLLYQAATGQVPFVASTPYEVLARATTEAHPSLHFSPAPFERLVNACLQKEPSQRPAHGAEVYGELLRIVEDPGAKGWLAEFCAPSGRVAGPTLKMD